MTFYTSPWSLFQVTDEHGPSCRWYDRVTLEESSQCWVFLTRGGFAHGRPT